MRRFLFCFLFFFLFSFIFSFSASDITSFSLENGLKVFVLPDSNSVTIRMELVVKSGFSFQNERNAGFFPLYAHLIGGEITADTVRIEKISSPNDFSKILGELSQCLENLRVSDSLLQKELSAMKETVTEYAASPAGFINTSIDSRIFSDAPWKTESGVYPALFSKNDVTQARIVLDEISRNYYTADNSLLFISGNITLKKAETEVKRLFSHSRVSTKTANPKSTNEPSAPYSKPATKKYVIVDDEFSKDMAQIVVQYKDFSKKECDALSKIFDEDFSTFKKDILADDERLGIRGMDYINAASSLTLQNSRLIIQSLLETTKKSSNPAEQSELFLKNISSNSEGKIGYNASRRIKREIEKEFVRFRDESDLLMSLFSSWAVINESFDAEVFFDNLGGFSDFTRDELSELAIKYENASPYVFVLVNTAVHKKYSKDFLKNGYETVTRKNGSWYSQSLYEKIIKNASDEKIAAEKERAEDGDSSWKNFVDSSKKSFSTIKLNNSIPVTIKRNETSSTTAISILISGGNLLFADSKPFLGTILTNAIADNIAAELYLREKSGVFYGKYTVHAKTDALSSKITITCQLEDLASCLEAAGKALVYGEITPAMADRLIYNERNLHRLKTGSTEHQILCSAVETIFKNSKLKKLYTTSDEILENVNFAEISENYPLLLDSTRYSLVITGATIPTSEILSVLNRTFGVLTKEKNVSKSQASELPPFNANFSPVTKKVKVRHTFLTDVSKDKAGPRPLVLVPTKKFLDPVLYVFKTPENPKEKALFEAVFIEISNRLQKELGFQNTVKFSSWEASLPISMLTVTQVEKISVVEQTYKRIVSKFTEELEDIENIPLLVSENGNVEHDGRKQILLDLENGWVTKNLAKVANNSETADLVVKGLASGDAQEYLKSYEAIATALAKDYISIVKDWVPETPQMRFYSADSR